MVCMSGVYVCVRVCVCMCVHMSVCVRLLCDFYCLVWMLWEPRRFITELSCNAATSHLYTYM